MTNRLAEYRMVSRRFILFLKMNELLYRKILKGKGVWWCRVEAIRAMERMHQYVLSLRVYHNAFL